MKSLRAALLHYDGKATTILGEAEARFSGEAGYTSELVRLSKDPEVQVSEGATWLLKASLDRGGRLSEDDTHSLIAGLEAITAWQAQLHVCQMMGSLTVPEETSGQVAMWLGQLLNHKRPFLRAWSLDALCRLSEALPGHRNAAKAALAQAARDPAASVKARARNIRLVGS